VRRVTLTDADRARLDDRFSSGRALRSTASRHAATPVRQDAEIVLVMGLPGAGKTTLTEELVAQGFARSSRDDTGGTLRDLLPSLDRALASNSPRIVLDNTYVSRKSRAEVIRLASAHGVPVRCIWLATSVEDAQVNAAWRIVSRYGGLPGEEELAALRKRDIAAFLPTVQFRYQRQLEPPDLSEGFARIDVVPFVRRFDPEYVNRALIVWCDDVLVRSRSGRRVPAHADDVAVVESRAAILRRYQDAGWRLLGLSWQPDIGAGTQSVAEVHAVFARMRELLGVAIDVEYCPHPAGPPRCWCRKPLPGLGVLLIQRHRLDPARCTYVADGPQDPGFSRRLGFSYRTASEFFGAP
jgi:histidinol phosphatase-like enzyme/predicted kinase